MKIYRHKGQVILLHQVVFLQLQKELVVLLQQVVFL